MGYLSRWIARREGRALREQLGRLRAREEELMPYAIRCRAKVVANCLDGAPTRRQFLEDLPMTEDGTWEADEHGEETIVCDPCYVALMPLTPSGQGLLEELPASIERARAS